MFGDTNGMFMPVAPAGGYGNGGGSLNGDGGWIVLLLLLAAFGGNWGNQRGNGGADGGSLYPWMNQMQYTQNGFNDAQLSAALAGLQNAVTAGFAGAEASGNARQTALMQQLFGMQQMQQQNCYENRLATQQLNSTILTEGCTDRAAVTTGVRDIIENDNRGFQRILDQMCNYQIEAKNEKIADLQRQLGEANSARLMESVGNRIIANNEAQTTALEQYLAPTPRPSYIVPNPNCCPNQQGNCGCY